MRRRSSQSTTRSSTITSSTRSFPCLAAIGAGRYLGLQERWDRLAVVRKHPILK